MKTIIIKNWCCLALPLWLILPPAVAEAKFPVLHKIHVATEIYWPYQSKGKDDKLIGAGMDIARRLLEHPQIDYTLAVYPWARAYKIAQTNKNVMIFSLIRTPERERQFKWIGTVAQQNYYLWSLAEGSKVSAPSLKDAKNYKIAVTRNGYAFQQLLRQGFTKSKQLVELNTNQPGVDLDMLLAGRVQMIAGSLPEVNRLLNNHNLNIDLLTRQAPINSQSQDLYIAMSLKTEDTIVSLLQEKYRELEGLGIIDKIQTEYGLSRKESGFNIKTGLE